MELEWSVLFEPEYRSWLLLGLKITVQLTVLSTLLALICGTVLGIFLLSSHSVVRRLALGYVTFFRNIPLVCLMFFCYFGLPLLLPQRWFGVLYTQNFEFRAAFISLSAYTTAFVAEVIRAGISAIPRGQSEAGIATGLSSIQRLRHIILPQAFRVIIPPLGNTFISNMKNSSLAMTIAVGELTWQAQQLESYTFRGFEAMTAVTIIYLLLSSVIAMLTYLAEKRFAVKKRRKSLFSISR